MLPACSFCLLSGSKSIARSHYLIGSFETGWLLFLKAQPVRGSWGIRAELKTAVMDAKHKDGEEPAGQGNGPASDTGTAWSENWGHATMRPVMMLSFLAHVTSALSQQLPVLMLVLLPIHSC